MTSLVLVSNFVVKFIRKVTRTFTLEKSSTTHSEKIWTPLSIDPFLFQYNCIIILLYLFKKKGYLYV